MTEQFSHPNECSDRLTQALQPLADLGETAAREYQQEAKALQTVERKYQAVKALYATAFRRVQSLEKTVKQLRQKWQQESC